MTDIGTSISNAFNCYSRRNAQLSHSKIVAVRMELSSLGEGKCDDLKLDFERCLSKEYLIRHVVPSQRSDCPSGNIAVILNFTLYIPTGYLSSSNIRGVIQHNLKIHMVLEAVVKDCSWQHWNSQ